MTPLRSLLLCLTVLLVGAVPPLQKVRERIAPPEFVRETVEDDEGMLQWAPIEGKCEACRGVGSATCQGCERAESMDNCSECKGEKRAPCRTCFGTKELIDPIVELGCPICRSSGWYDCGNCNGFAELKISQPDGSVTTEPCRACKKVGRYECAVCDGEMRITAVRVKKKPAGEAKLKDLQSVRETLAETLKAFEAFQPLEKFSKSLKAMDTIVKRPSSVRPELKKMVAQLEEAVKGLTRAGAGLQSYEENLEHQFLIMKDRTVYMLQHDLRVLDQCIARVEANEAKAGN